MSNPSQNHMIWYGSTFIECRRTNSYASIENMFINCFHIVYVWELSNVTDIHRGMEHSPACLMTVLNHTYGAELLSKLSVSVTCFYMFVFTSPMVSMLDLPLYLLLDQMWDKYMIVCCASVI